MDISIITEFVKVVIPLAPFAMGQTAKIALFVPMDSLSRIILAKLDVTQGPI
jgi:hypothetical protein